MAKHLESPAAPQHCQWGGNISLGAGSQPLGFASKPPHFSLQVFVLAPLLIFNPAFNSVAFISDRNSDLSPFLSLAGLSNQIFHGGLGWISLLQLQNTQEVGSMGTPGTLTFPVQEAISENLIDFYCNV